MGRSFRSAGLFLSGFRNTTPYVSRRGRPPGAPPGRHFLPRIEPFQSLAAPFPAVPVLVSRTRASAGRRPLDADSGPRPRPVDKPGAGSSRRLALRGSSGFGAVDIGYGLLSFREAPLRPPIPIGQGARSPGADTCDPGHPALSPKPISSLPRRPAFAKKLFLICSITCCRRVFCMAPSSAPFANVPAPPLSFAQTVETRAQALEATEVAGLTSADKTPCFLPADGGCPCTRWL